MTVTNALRTSSANSRADAILKEYETFAYVVSHDLSAPLRHVKEFTRLLIGGKRDELSEEEREYINYLERSLEKLETMQEALLSFSRVKTHAGPLKHVDCNEAVAQALEELDHMVVELAPAFECIKLPTLMAEPNQIIVLFRNLIENAFKFHRLGTDKRKVSISADKEDGHWVFKIEDNGIGIDERNHENALTMFRRLEPNAYDGIGAGLTIAHKIVQEHGGEMSIESEPGKGTAVYFTLPSDLVIQ